MLLFLDIDGVLHPIARRAGPLSCLPAFEAVLREFEYVEVVIISSWRLEYDLAQLRSMFSADIAPRLVDVTPNRATIMASAEPYRREREIEDWLRENGREYEPWLVLDDCDWMYSPSYTRLILVDSTTGFDGHTAKALRGRMPSENRAPPTD